MPSGIFYNSLDRSISSKMGIWLVLLLLCFIEIPVLMKHLYPDQTPRSDLGLYCMPVPLLWDARHKRASISFLLT